MSADSLFPGGLDGGASVPGGVLDSSDRALLDALLKDFVGGPAVDFDGGKLLNGSGPGGEKQGALTPGTGQLEGPITNGDLTMEVDIPAGTGLTFTGKDGQTPDAAENYLNTAIGGYFSANVDPNSDAGQQQQSLTGAVDDLLGSLGGGKDISVRLIDFLGKNSPGGLNDALTDQQQDGRSASTLTISDSDSTYQGADSLIGANEVLLDAGTSKGKQVFMLNIGNIPGGNKTLVVANLEGAILAGTGTMRVEGNTPIYVTSDIKAQKVTGGGGADTLVGAGNDTLTGGAGSDLFGFNKLSKGGKVIITDFNKAADKLAFEFAGITTVDQLKAKVTAVKLDASGITYSFGPDQSITLVGIGAGELTSSMFKFII